MKRIWSQESYPSTTAHLDLTVEETHERFIKEGKSMADAWQYINEVLQINSMHIGLPTFDKVHFMWQNI